LGSSGAFNFSKNTDSFYLGLHKSFNFQKSSLFLTGFKSFLKDNRFNNSLITGTENIETSFYKVGISISNLFESVDLKVEYTKPLFISRGLLNLTLPVYRDRYLNLYNEEVSLALSPDHQETITSVSLNKFTGNSSIALRLENVENPYHGNIYKDYLNFSLGFKYSF
jgi:hypothetical protein